MKYLIIVCLLLLLSCSKSNSEDADSQLRQQIGQMLMVGFRGTQINRSSQIVTDITQHNLGGVVLFDYDVALASYGRNITDPDQLSALTSSLKEYASTPLLIAIDQEGGRINRLKPGYGFPKSVSQQYLGTLNNPDSTRFYAGRTAQTLSEMGINVNFAPVVDLNINPENPVIGGLERSFSADPAVVITHSQIVIEEHSARNIFCTLKHFPGHGSSSADSHHDFVDVTSTWSESELLPYHSLTTYSNILVMTAHIFNSELDPDYPATLSNKIITDILRNEIGFSGVIFSDDMTMKAIIDYYGLESALELAINAGVDILIFGNNLVYDEMIVEKTVSQIIKLVNDGKISRERINESYQRIMTLKNSLRED